MDAKKTIAVFDPNNVYLSHATSKRALTLLQSGKAIRIDATTIKLKHTKKESVETRHKIISDARRICYICNRVIPVSEKATIDHVIPRSRAKNSDTAINMRCCCRRCNEDKNNRTLSEYIEYIIDNREQYHYISSKQIKCLINFCVNYETKFRFSTYSQARLEKLKHMQCKKGRI